MEQLFLKAWGRFKNKFLRYFLITAISLGVYLLLTVLSLLLAGLFFAIFWFSGKSLFLIPLLVVPYLAIVVTGWLYMGSWMELTKIMAVTADDIKDLADTFAKTKPLVWQFLGYGVLSGLFFIGLLYTNFLLFIPAIMWYFWGLFASFSFLEGKRGKLAPLWYSKAVVNQSFGKVFFYVAVLTLASMMLTGAFTYIDDRLAALNTVLWFVSSLFLLSFNYELYRSLPKPKEYRSSRGWLILSVIGWLLIPFMVITLFGNNQLNLQNWQKLKNFELPKELPIRDRSNVM